MLLLSHFTEEEMKVREGKQLAHGHIVRGRDRIETQVCPTPKCAICYKLGAQRGGEG